MALQIRRGTDADWEATKQNIKAGEPAIALDTGRFFVGTDEGEFAEFANVENYYDKNDVDDIEDALQTSIGTKADASNVYTKAQVDASLALKADKSDTYTKAQTDSALGLKANTADVNAALALKADKSDTYTKTEVNNALALKADADDVYTKTEADALLDNKANIDGSYDGMTVGNAEQLIATQYVEDSEPYLFRTTGGSADVGNREYFDEIVGGTVAWNQLAKAPTLTNWAVSSDCTLSISDEVMTFTAHAKYDRLYCNTGGVKLVDGHKYLFGASVKLTTALTGSWGARLALGNSAYNQCSLYLGSTVPAGSFVDLYTVKSLNADGNNIVDLVFFQDSRNSDRDAVQIKNFMAIDLTQMFGTTIADYIYSLETANAGAGVAWFKKLFPNDYYQYNAGELISVSGLSSHDTVGFNQWDEEWEVGGYNATTGEKVTNNTQIRSKNFIPVVEGNTYYMRTNGKVFFIPCYDADKNYLGVFARNEQNYTSIVDQTFVLPTGTKYINFYSTNYGTTYNHDICINLSWSGYRNGEYEPYVKHSYPLDSSLTLRGIPKLDASNQLYYDGDTYEHDGTVTRKYGIVDLGTRTWSYNANTFGGSFGSLISDAGYSASGNSICAKYPTVFSGTDITNGDKVVYTKNNGKSIYIKDTTYSDAATFKSAMSGVYLVYELETPTTEQADAYQQVQICDDFGTEEFVSTSIVPVGHNTRYPDNLRDKLQHLPSLASSDGYYMISQQDNSMSLELFRIPKAPTTDGTYTLKATVSGGTPTYTWESEV